MMFGRVSWFNDGSGEGVIRGENGKNYFVHYSAIQQSGRKSLNRAEVVKIEVLDDEFARHCTKVYRVELTNGKLEEL